MSYVMDEDELMLDQPATFPLSAASGTSWPCELGRRSRKRVDNIFGALVLLQSQPETTSERTLALQRCFVLAEKLSDHSWEEYQAKTLMENSSWGMCQLLQPVRRYFL